LFLLSKRRWKEFRTTIKYIAKTNGKELDENFEDFEYNMKVLQFEDITKTLKSKTYLKKAPGTFDLLSYSSLRKDLILAGILFSFCNYCYYGSLFGLEALKGNIYFNSLFSAVADIIGYAFIDWTV